MTTRRHHRLIASGCLAAAGIAAASTPRGGRAAVGTPRARPCASFAHGVVRPRFGHRPRAPALRAASDDGPTVDPRAVWKDDSAHLPPPPSPSWGVADDWTVLSSSSAGKAAPATFASASEGGYDVNEAAARILHDQEEMMGEWDAQQASAAKEDDGGGEEDPARAEPAGEDFVENAVDVISSNSDYFEADVQLYDTASSAAKERNPVADERDRQEDEMALMIRCNRSPEQFLIDQGKALPELTEKMKYAPEFLLEGRSEMVSGAAEAHGATLPRLPLRPKATAYFADAVEGIFDAHSVPVVEGAKGGGRVQRDVLNRKSLSKWMTKCLSSPIASGAKPFVIGPHDQSVSAILSRFSRTHGSGRLTLPEFQVLYLEVAWAGYVRDIMSRKIPFDTEGGHMPTADAGILIRGRQNTERMVLDQATLSLIWRDLEAHAIFSPAEEERVRALLEIESQRAQRDASAPEIHSRHLLMDECELTDFYEEGLSHRAPYNEDGDDDPLGTEGGWDFLKRKEKSSHKLVEMASDGETPKRIRDGKFIFIDEESCIGCNQCAQIAPSSFKMIEDTGRARTFAQSESQDVADAVMACPVSCMHSMSFDELKEMETSRDDGDGRTDHRHFGGGKTHTPLSVAGMDSDANHKSSWYHYLKWKCHGSTCDERGCYDCPQYAPGENPFFKERHARAENVRAMDFIESGEADKWRKVVEL